MSVEQLSLLDPAPETPAKRLARPRARRTDPPRPAAPSPTATLAAGEVLVEHRYPEAFEFLREHGPDAVAVLTVLLVDAEVVEGRLVVAASTRGGG